MNTREALTTCYCTTVVCLMICFSVWAMWQPDTIKANIGVVAAKSADTFIQNQNVSNTTEYR